MSRFLNARDPYWNGSGLCGYRFLGSNDDLGKLTFADITKLSPWWLITALSAGTIAVRFSREPRERRRRSGN